MTDDLVNAHLKFHDMDAPGGERKVKDMIPRYLAAVERRLPNEQAKDIIAELSEAIASKIEAKEAQLGRAAADDEIADVLKSFGHPVVVASRYSGRDHLIGPQLYPWFWDAQRVGVGLVLAIGLIVLGVRALGADAPISFVFRGIGNILEGAVLAFGMLTVVFVMLERTKTDLRLAARWSPKTLPQDHIRKPRSLFESVFTFAFDIVFILWWVRVIDFPNEVPGRNNSMELHFAEAWAQLHAPILVLALLTAAVHLSDILHPGWSRLRAVISILGHVGGLAVLWVLFRAGPLVSVTASAEESQRAFEVANFINGIFGPVLGIVGLFWAIGMGVEIWRLIQSVRPKIPTASVAI
ncbi:MAG TPA: hypothetical protein VIA80_11005 [Hyphomonadaceae bacterium]